MTDQPDAPEPPVVVDNDMMHELARITNEAVRQTRAQVGAAGFDGISYVAISAVFAAAVHEIRERELMCTCANCDEDVRVLATEIYRLLYATTHDAAARGRRMN